MTVVAPTLDRPSYRWCWIGDPNSEYLNSLTHQLAQRRPHLGEAITIELSRIDARSTTKLHKLLAKTPSDFFVWFIPPSGLTGLLGEIDMCQSRYRTSRQIAAGLASTQERTRLFEAGCCWHVEQPDDWATCLASVQATTVTSRQPSRMHSSIHTRTSGIQS